MFPKEDWSDTVYDKCIAQLTPNARCPRDLGFTIRAYIDSDHAGDSVTRRYSTGFIIIFNNSLMYWNSKKQGSCETSSFGSEYITMKTYHEYAKGLRYKHRMIGITCDYPCYVFGDKQ